MTERMTIVSPDGVNQQWMADALAQRGIDADIADLRMETVGTGQLGETRRYIATTSTTREACRQAHRAASSASSVH